MTDDNPRYLDDDRGHRRGRILAVAATILLVVGAVIWLLGIPLWIVLSFIVVVFLGILLST